MMMPEAAFARVRKATAALAVAGALTCATSSGALAASPEDFPRPAVLEAPIRFWRAIFAGYSTDQVVVHDADDLTRIYKVLDFRAAGSSEAARDRLREVATKRELARVRRTLVALATDPGGGSGSDPETARIRGLFPGDVDARELRRASGAKVLRAQRGLHERFAAGLRIARKYWPAMERIFRREGLPVELVYLPLVESSFNVRAESKVGAVGIWQFMPATARHFGLRVTPRVDERRDPIASTRAAARYLRVLHQHLKSWPLAISAYNHGPGGIVRAMHSAGSTDIGDIVRRHHSARFGFASRNFYAEFLAALDAARGGEPPRNDLPVQQVMTEARPASAPHPMQPRARPVHATKPAHHRGRRGATLGRIATRQQGLHDDYDLR
jgi:membrane-bound lytic murein transglycosylase D